MKTFFPKNIKKGIFAGMMINIGIVSISMIQLFILAIGIGIGVGTFSIMSKSGNKAIGMLFAIAIILMFTIIAFFKVSEMNIIEFIAKLIRTNFFDTTRKFQVDYPRMDKVELLILHQKEKNKSKKKNFIEAKELNKDFMEKIEKESLI